MGLYLSSAVLTLRTCSITNNDGGSNAGWGGSADGAGIYCVASSVDLLDCTIANNAAGDGSDEFAGDRPLFDPFGELRVPESSVVPADGYPGGNGGGIDATGNSLVRAFSCRLLDNRSGNGGYASNPNLGGHGGLGAGICLDTSSRLEAFNCQICGGRTGNGGATWLGIGGDGGNGAGIYVGASSSLYATNCLIAGNRCEWRLKSAAPGGLPTVG
jgi:hypothetical protein